MLVGVTTSDLESDEEPLRPRPLINYRLMADKCLRASQIPKLNKHANDTASSTKEFTPPLSKHVLKRKGPSMTEAGSSKKMFSQIRQEAKSQISSTKIPKPVGKGTPITNSSRKKNLLRPNSTESFIVAGTAGQVITTNSGLPSQILEDYPEEIYQDYVIIEAEDENSNPGYTVEYEVQPNELISVNEEEYAEELQSEQQEIELDVYENNDEEVSSNDENESNATKPITVANINSIEKLTDVMSMLVLKLDRTSKNVSIIKKMMKKGNSTIDAMDDMNFPLKTLDGLNEFEEKLGKDKAFNRKLVSSSFLFKLDSNPQQIYN